MSWSLIYFFIKVHLMPIFFWAGRVNTAADISVRLTPGNSWLLVQNMPVHLRYTKKHQKDYSAVQQVLLFLCSLLARLMVEQLFQRFYWPENAVDWPEPCIMNMRSATCVETQTSMVPTRVSFLFVFYSVKY